MRETKDQKRAPATGAAPATEPQEVRSVDEARAHILSALTPLGDELVLLPAASGRILAEPLRARRDLPAFDNSAMDGIGVRVDDVRAASDGPVRLRLLGSALPGQPTPLEEGRPLPPGHAVRIMTGAPVPEGVEAVVMREHTDESRVTEGFIAVLAGAAPGQHIRRRGEDVAVDDIVGAAGDALTPARLNLLLSAGHVTARVQRRPIVAVVASGDELKEVGLPLAATDVVNSNAHAVAAAARELGCDVHLLGIARDTLEDHVRHMQDGRFADVLVTIGGVSMGTHDFVRPALAHLGATLEMWRVAMRPGKPIAFGRTAGDASAGRASQVIFGLPGNPVSSLVSFELFVRPALLKMMGVRATTRPLWRATLVDGGFKKKPGLEHWARGEARLSAAGALEVRLSDQQGSHQISAMARGNALVKFAPAVESVAAGAAVELMLLTEPWTAADMA
jgi:molybdopterin molybdotransferase